MKATLKIIYILSVAFSLKSYAQNSIPNSSFENYISCPHTSAAVNLLSSGWVGYSADYYNACDTSNYVGIPQSIGGYQYAHFGNGYVGLYGYQNGWFLREYIEVKLNNTLISGQTYYVSFYVSLADTSRYAIENIGALFTDTLFDPFPAPSYNWQTGNPQIENSAGNMLNSKINLVQIKDSFIASGGENYITIGNFRNDAQTVKQFVGGGASFSAAYYYIDDIYVSEVPLGIEEVTVKNEDLAVYPNPNNGVFTITTNSPTKSTIIISNVLGETIYEAKTITRHQQIDLSGYAKGLYNLRWGAMIKHIVIQ